MEVRDSEVGESAAGAATPPPAMALPTVDVTPSAPPTPSSGQMSAGRILGRGRSGFVYHSVGEDGRELACKVFDSRSLTKLVQCVLLGTPNPYMWSEDAVRCALLRRRILASLVEFWFGDRVSVAAAVGYAWNEKHRAYELHTEFTEGRPIPLKQPFRRSGESLLGELTRDVMRPLQDHLIAAGMDGMVWQAGKGNPVALNNFLLERDGAEHRWVWIDLESGVPALVPANPLALLGFYLPRSLVMGRPMFDDVRVDRLLGYLATHADGIAGRLGAAKLCELQAKAIELRGHQAAWKSMPLHWRGIAYHHAAGRITDREAEFYRRSRIRWMGRELARHAGNVARRVARLPSRIWRFLKARSWSTLPRLIARSVTSHRFRTHLARRFLGKRIRSWRLRGQLLPAEANLLREQLRSREASAYLGDFGVHLAIKPFAKVTELWVFPMLWGMGCISTPVLALGMVAVGCAARTLYTLTRTIQATFSGREKPWVALSLGAFPVLGNFAYPLQIAYSSSRQGSPLATFMWNDCGARLGCLLPIWGGQDTWTEHFFNRLPGWMLGRFRPATPSPPRCARSG